MHGIAENALRPWIPARDDSVERLGNDGIVGRFDDRREPAAHRIPFLALRDVLDDAEELRGSAALVVQQRDRRIAPENASSFADVALLEAVAVDRSVEQPQNLCLRCGPVVRVGELHERSFLQFLDRVPQHRTETEIRLVKRAVEIGDADADGSLRKHRAQSLFAGCQCALRFASGRDVMKDHDGADDCVVCVADRRGAVLDRPLGAVTTDQRGVIRESDDVAAGERLLDGVLCRLSRVFIDDPKHTQQRLPLSFAVLPARHGLGHRIQEGHAAVDVRRDHGVADAGQRDFVPSALLQKLLRLALQSLVRLHEAALGALARLQNSFDVF